MKSSITKVGKRLGPASTKVGVLTLALVAAPVLGAAAYGATNPFAYEESPCVVATLVKEPSFAATRGYCENAVLPDGVIASPAPANGSNTATPTPTAGSGSTTPPSSEGSTSSPTPSTPAGSAGLNISTVDLYSTNANKMVLLNNGGFIEVVNNVDAWITPTKGASPKQITGLPPKWRLYNNYLDVNASPDGQTIVVYYQSGVVVSFDGGATWSPEKISAPYGGYATFMSSTVSGDGKTVALSTGTSRDSSGTLVYLNKDWGTALTSWKSTWMGNQYELSLSDNGSQIITTRIAPGSVYQTSIDLSVASPTRTTNDRYPYSWLNGFATTGDQQLQIHSLEKLSDSGMYLYLSKDGGKTLTEKIKGSFSSLSMSKDGVVQAGIDTYVPDKIYAQLQMSFDSGETWKKMDILDGVKLRSVTVAPDGKMIRIITDDGKSYFSYINR